MLSQLLLGSALICTTIAVEVSFISMASAALTKIGSTLSKGRKSLKLTVSLLAVVLWILVAISIAVWIWAAAFLILGQFENLETALYFSVVSMTTLGYGDITIGKEWRLLSGLIAANGLILFSLATAFFIEFFGRLRKAQTESETS